MRLKKIKNNSRAFAIWLDVKGFEGVYEVNQFGDIRNVLTGKGRRKYNFLTAFPDGHGYMQVTLKPGWGRFNKSVHRIVAWAFLGSRPEGYQVDHIDGDKTNNEVSNLRYVTPKENIRSAIVLGLIQRKSLMRFCKRGHEFTESNTYRQPSRPWQRICRLCKRLPRLSLGIPSRQTPLIHQ